MKLKARTLKAIAGLFNPETNPAIVALVEFAAQNSGLEPRNYCDPHDREAGRLKVYLEGVKAYESESRSISADWERFKAALAQASADGVTDADVINEAPHAFSGRLTWVSKDYLREKHGLNTDYTPRWDYCTGQYFPTEYRKAAATLLEYAARKCRQARPAEKRLPASIADLKALNEQNGGCWFEASTMRFFRTRIESGILCGHYFVTSEQREDNTPRKFTVRSFDNEGSVETVGEFHEYSTKAEAVEALREHVKGVNLQPVVA